jgi:2-methylisocitrate lyase-like PEP mutase family enzyme
MRSTTRLKALLAGRRALLLPGAANGLFARLIEDAGFEAAYVSGAGVANMFLGVPDIGLTTMTEIADHVAAITDAVAIPVLVDADTGYGNALNAMRAMRALERAGAAGLQIEDQVFPKKCGHFSGKEIVPLGEMLNKVKALVDARQDADLQIVARTDARAILGIEAAIDRAHAMIEAGADVTFVEAPTSGDEIARIARELPVPQIANVVFGGLTPELGRDRLAELGYGGVLYANATLQAAVRSSKAVLDALRDDGSLSAVSEMLADFDERQAAVKKSTYDELERRYREEQTTGKETA